MSAEAGSAGERRQTAAPVPSNERIETLDVLRGFALFGILLVNMYDYLAVPVGILDQTVHRLVMFFAEDNFYPLFSLLFGAGFAIQMLRAKEKSVSGASLYLRRIAVLFVMAVGFWIVLEDRNILLRYAFLALPLMLFRTASPRVLLAAGVCCIGLSAYAPHVGRAIQQVRVQGLTQEQITERRAQAQQLREQGRALWQEAMAGGSYMDFVRLRARSLGRQLESLVFGVHFTLPHIFALFLLGIYAIRQRIVQEPERHLSLLRGTIWVGLIVGTLGEMVAYIDVEREVGGTDPRQLLRILELTGWIALSLAYAAGLTLLMRKDQWKRRLEWMAPVGRMALTSYMLQSVFMTLIFLPFGLGLNAKLGPSIGALLTIGIFGLQVILSRWWLSHFRFGPAEWLWRTFTYGRLQPMRPRHAEPAPVPRI